MSAGGGHGRSPLVAIGLVCLGFGIFNLSDAAVKLMLENGHGIFFIMFWQAVFGVAGLCIGGAVAKGGAAFRSGHYRLHVLRGVCAVAIFALNMYALEHIQLDEFYALVFMAPLWIVVFGALYFGDRPGPQRMAAIVTGFCAVLYMLRPDAGLFGMGALAVVASTMIFAVQSLCVRLMPENESAMLYGLSGAAMSFVLLLPFAPQIGLPTAEQLPILCFIGVGGGIAALFVGLGFRRAPSSATVAPFHYTQMLWGVVLGYVLFGDAPNASVMGGAAVLVMTGMYLLRYETRAAGAAEPRPVLRRSE